MMLQLCLLNYILEMLSCRKVHMVTKAKFFQVVTDFASSWGLGGGVEKSKDCTICNYKRREILVIVWGFLYFWLETILLNYISTRNLKIWIFVNFWLVFWCRWLSPNLTLSCVSICGGRTVLEKLWTQTLRFSQKLGEKIKCKNVVKLHFVTNMKEIIV